MLAISNAKQKGSAISHSEVSDLGRVLVERDQLKEELARQNKEIEKLRETIQFVLQHFRKAEVDTPEEIPSGSTAEEKQQGPSTPDPLVRSQDVAAKLGKRSREESNSPPNEKSEESNNPPPNKKVKTEYGWYSTINEYFDPN